VSPFQALAIECSGDRIATCVFDAEGKARALRSRPSAHEHARHLLALIEGTLADAELTARELSGVAIDVGPGSFTALRVGLATARGLTQPFATPLVGVTSFAALLEGRTAPRRLAVPLIVAGRGQLYAGFYRGNAAGAPTILRGPAAGNVEVIAASVREALALCPKGFTPWFLGPGAARDRDALEAAFPGSTVPPASDPDGDAGVAGVEGPRAESLALLGARRLSGRGAAAAPRPLYVRVPQALEKGPPKRSIESELVFAPFTESDLDEVLPIETAVFSDPWPRQFFLEELRVPQSIACVARHRDKLAGYLLAWQLEGETHLGNLAVVPEYQRRGVGQALLSWLIERARTDGPGRITLEVRSSNFAAQELYRRFGFQAVALRRGYYQDSGEDALVMMRDFADA
jgi:ribosomal-protein-alanine N-acetyltransferase